MGPLDRVATAANHTIIAYQPLLPAYSARVLGALNSGTNGAELVAELNEAQDPMGINEARRGYIVGSGEAPPARNEPVDLTRLIEKWKKYQEQEGAANHPNFSYLLRPDEE